MSANFSIKAGLPTLQGNSGSDYNGTKMKEESIMELLMDSNILKPKTKKAL